jgi:hypothetical protein
MARIAGERRVSILLSPDEVVALTGYRRPSAQIRALRAMQIQFRVPPDGRPRVFRAQFDQPLAVPDKPRTGPNWAALG